MEIKTQLNPNRKKFPTEELGFGRFFTDHMFMATFEKSTGWRDASIVPYAPLAIDPGAAVLHYGQALFEGLKAFRGVDQKIRLFRPEMNSKRLRMGSERLCMEAPDTGAFMQGLLKLVQIERDWVPSSPGTALYLRPTLIGTEAFLGVRPAEKFMFYIIASPVGAYYGARPEPVSIWIESRYARAAHGGIGATKSGGNYAASLLAAIEAKKRGFSQVLWLDAATHTQVEEVGTMNVFFVINGKVITPALNGNILPGVMRDSTLRYLEAMNMPVEERAIELAEIMAAAKDGTLTEAFGSGTAASICPIASFGTVDGVVKIADGSGSGPITVQLMNFFNDLQYGKIDDNFGWTVDIDEAFQSSTSREDVSSGSAVSGGPGLKKPDFAMRGYDFVEHVEDSSSEANVNYGLYSPAGVKRANTDLTQS